MYEINVSIVEHLRSNAMLECEFIILCLTFELSNWDSQSAPNTYLFFITPVQNSDFKLIGSRAVDGVRGVNPHSRTITRSKTQ